MPPSARTAEIETSSISEMQSHIALPVAPPTSRQCCPTPNAGSVTTLNTPSPSSHTRLRRVVRSSASEVQRWRAPRGVPNARESSQSVQRSGGDSASANWVPHAAQRNAVVMGPSNSGPEIPFDLAGASRYGGEPTPKGLDSARLSPGAHGGSPTPIDLPIPARRAAPLVTTANSDRILILDYGSQFTQLIARRIREQRVYCEIHPPALSRAEIEAWNPAGIVLSGGPSSVLDEGSPDLDLGILDLGRPVLGICYGLQLLAHRLGGVVEKADDREYGRARLETLREDLLLGGAARGEPRVVWMSHGDRVLRLPPGFVVLARSDHSPFAAVRHSERPIWGLQFHPEVTHTQGGAEILARFAREVCGARGRFTMEAFVEEQTLRIRE